MKISLSFFKFIGNFERFTENTMSDIYFNEESD